MLKGCVDCQFSVFTIENIKTCTKCVTIGNDSLFKSKNINEA